MKIKETNTTVSHVVYLPFIGNISESFRTELLMKFSLAIVVPFPIYAMGVMFLHCWNCVLES
jgi:hypothetical protein